MTYVPTTLNEAVSILCANMPDWGRMMIKALPPEAVDGYVAGIRLGRRMNLNDETSELHQWFRTNLGLWHPSDMGQVLLDAVSRKVRGEPRRTAEIVERCRTCWLRQGIDPYTGERVRAAPRYVQFTPPRTIFNN